jgi:hypothetical protein
VDKRETVPLYTTPKTPPHDNFMKFENGATEADPELDVVAAYPDYAVVRDVVDALRREVSSLRDEVGILRGEVNILRRGEGPEEEDFL